MEGGRRIEFSEEGKENETEARKGKVLDRNSRREGGKLEVRTSNDGVTLLF